MAWIVAGAGTGVLHATMLQQATHRLSAWTPVMGMLRLGIVAAVLISAALAGGILAAAAGWFAGLLAASVRIVMRRTNTAPPTRHAGSGD